MNATAVPRSVPLPAPWAWTRLVVGFLTMSIAAVVLLSADLLLLPWRQLRIRGGNVYGKVVGSAMVWLAGTRPRIHHAERLKGTAPAIYVSNHTSTLDIFLGMWLCPMGGCGIAKKEVARIPFFGWAYKLSGHLLLDRHNRDNAIAALRDVAAVVRRHGLSIWLWPEGTRSRDGRLQDFKKGFVHLALATGLPVVPVVVHGADHRWPGRSAKLIPGPLDISVLEPIDTRDWSLQTVEQHVHDVHELFRQALGETGDPFPTSR